MTLPQLEALTSSALERCDELARITQEPGQTTRTYLSGAALTAMERVKTWMLEAGLQTSVDAAGNVRGVKPGKHGAAKTLIVGSHIDTVPNAGKYDGVLGVMLGIALATALKNEHLPFHLELVAFSEEEGVRFKTPFIGSRALVGTAQGLLTRQDETGQTVADAMRGAGLDPSQLPQAAYQPAHVLGYFEIHIEQGPVLENLRLPIGAVTGIAGQTRLAIEFRGRAAHAGTTPMHLRKDALTAAAALIGETERYAKATPGLVATVGELSVEPGAGNVVPAKATLSLDVRHLHDAVREKAVAELLDFAWQTAQRRGLDVTQHSTLEQQAVPCDPLWTDFLCDACEDTGQKPHRLPSGAGHDAMVMAALGPMAMLFLRSPGGVSHHPDETVVPKDARVALTTALDFVQKLAKHYRTVDA